MFEWVKRLFGATDRVTAAGERAAKAAEDIADMIEQARDQIRERFVIAAPAPTVAAISAGAEQPAAEGGKRKKAAG